MVLKVLDSSLMQLADLIYFMQLFSFVCLFVLADGRGIQIETVPPNKVGIH